MPQLGGSLLGGDLGRTPTQGHTLELCLRADSSSRCFTQPRRSRLAPTPSALLQRPPGLFLAGCWFKSDPQPRSGCCAPANPQLCLQDLRSPRHPPPPKASPHPCGPPPPKASPHPSLAHPSSASLGSRQRGPGKAGPEPLGAPRLVGGAGPRTWATCRSPGMASWGGEAAAPRELPEVGRLAWTAPTHCLLLDIQPGLGRPPAWGLAHPGFLPASGSSALACSSTCPLQAPPVVLPARSSPHHPPPGAGPGLPCPCAPSVQTPSAEQAPRTSLTREMGSPGESGGRVRLRVRDIDSPQGVSHLAAQGGNALPL